MAFHSEENLRKIGLKSVGRNVKVDTTVVFIFPARISIGDHTRIDAYSIISGKGHVTIGRHVHISCYVSLLGEGEIEVGDYAGLSAKVSIFSSNDDYSGAYLTGPTVPAAYKNVHTAKVSIGRREPFLLSCYHS
jgi:galactoside O-acetyltransferase